MYLPLGKGLSHSFEEKKIEFPSPEDDLCQVWLKLAVWFWRRFFKKKMLCIFTLLLLSPRGEGLSSSFKDT
jgi:hypothetical protein